MGKKRNYSQRVGTAGENAFRYFAQRQGLIPTKVDEDFGTDFICQIDTTQDIRRTGTIHGSFIGACVRATTKDVGRIRLGRSDAEHLLRANCPVGVFLVRLKENNDPRDVFFRFVDEQFAVELGTFLASDKQRLPLLPGQCKLESEFPAELARATEGNLIERVRLTVAEHRVSKLIPSARLEVRRSRDGELSFVTAANFFDYFERSAEPTQDKLYVAVFGAPHLQMRRLNELEFRKGLMDSLAPLSRPYVIGGPTIKEPVELVVRSQTGEETRCTFLRTSSGTHYGYVHPDGISLTISKPKQQQGKWVHERDAFVDPEVEFDLSAAQELFDFLERCCPGASIREAEDAPEHAHAVESFRGLPYLCGFAMYLRAAMQHPGWNRGFVWLKNAQSEETINTMLWLALLTREPSPLDGLGFIYEGIHPKDCTEHPDTFEIPLIGNVPAGSIIAWVHVRGVGFIHEGETCGLRIDRVLGVQLEMRRPALKKTTEDPELVIHRGMSTLVLGSDGTIRLGDPPAVNWNLAARSTGGK